MYVLSADPYQHTFKEQLQTYPRMKCLFHVLSVSLTWYKIPSSSRDLHFCYFISWTLLLSARISSLYPWFVCYLGSGSFELNSLLSTLLLNVMPHRDNRAHAQWIFTGCLDDEMGGWYMYPQVNSISSPSCLNSNEKEWAMCIGSEPAGKRHCNPARSLHRRNYKAKKTQTDIGWGQFWIG